MAFAAFQSLSDRFDEVSARSDRQALALEIKYAVTDVNGWQTAYGYDGGASRPQFERSAQNVRRLLAVADRRLTEPRERAILARLQTLLRRVHGARRRRLSRAARGPGAPRQADLPRARRSATSRRWRPPRASSPPRSSAATTRCERAFDQRLTDAKKSLVVVGLGAGVLIVLLLLTASDIARLALEQQASREP